MRLQRQGYHSDRLTEGRCSYAQSLTAVVLTCHDNYCYQRPPLIDRRYDNYTPLYGTAN